MKLIGMTSTAVLCLLLGIAGAAYAQHGQQGDKKDNHEEQQGKHEQARPEAKHAQQQHQAPQHVQQQRQNKPQAYGQQHRDNAQSQRPQDRQRVQQSAWQQHRAQNWQSDHRTWQQRGGYSGYRISDSRYRGYFGPEHGFRIRGLPFLMMGGHPRFQYNGYWFSLVDPWPEYWANNWYDTDDVYVNYVDNGYYLFNRRYPSDGIAISISLR